MKRIVFFDTDQDYSCTRIMSPNDMGEFSELPATATNVREVDEADIPADRTFRNAWNADFSVDMAKARNIHRQRIRLSRAPKLAALDILYQKADEAGDGRAKTALAARKQVLRDAPGDPRIEMATSPAELIAIVPDELVAP